MTMLEKMVAALREHAIENYEYDEAEIQAAAVAGVRAALLAIREPGDDVSDAGFASADPDDGLDSLKCWAAMIDAILNETEETKA